MSADTSVQARRRILVIDDDEVLLATTEALLGSFGYEVATHSGGFGASSLIKKLQPDLILLDVNMPGLSGPALAALVRREGWAEGIRVFFHSSNDEALLQATVDESGADGYVRKGDRAELREKISRALCI